MLKERRQRMKTIKLIATIVALLMTVVMMSTLVTPVFAADSPTFPSVPPKSKLIESITWTGEKSFDGGNVGWWALDTFTEHDQIFLAPDDTYYFFATGFGTWQTFEGALSPNKGVVEPKDGSGIYCYQEFTYFTATAFSPEYKTCGYVGTFNYINNGETSADAIAVIKLGTYSAQLPEWNGYIPFDPIASYFTYNANSVNQIDGNFLGSSTYVYAHEVMREYIIGNLPVIMIGDIVT
jgi:hypothetical protein